MRNVAGIYQNNVRNFFTAFESSIKKVLHYKWQIAIFSLWTKMKHLVIQFKKKTYIYKVVKGKKTHSRLATFLLVKKENNNLFIKILCNSVMLLKMSVFKS